MSLSSKHGFFFAREKASSTPGVSRTASVSMMKKCALFSLVQTPFVLEKKKKKKEKEEKSSKRRLKKQTPYRTQTGCSTTRTNTNARKRERKSDEREGERERERATGERRRCFFFSRARGRLIHRVFFLHVLEEVVGKRKDISFVSVFLITTHKARETCTSIGETRRRIVSKHSFGGGGAEQNVVVVDFHSNGGDHHRRGGGGGGGDQRHGMRNAIAGVLDRRGRNQRRPRVRVVVDAFARSSETRRGGSFAWICVAL